MRDKKQALFVILAAIFLTNAVLAELIGVKIFSLEKSLDFDISHLQILGYDLAFNLTAGVMIWPVVFITTDVINEYFGKKGVRKLTFLAVGCILYAFVMIFLTSKLMPATFWLDIHKTDPKGNPFDINFAFNKIYLQSSRIILASIVAFLVSQFLDVVIFQKIKSAFRQKMIWLRATGSTLVSQLIDSFVVLMVAFHFLAPEESRWTFDQVISVGIINYMYKFLIAVLLTPLIYLAHTIIDNYLGKELAMKMKTDY